MNCLERMVSKTRNTVHCSMYLNENMRKKRILCKKKERRRKTKEELDHDFDTYYECYKQYT